jgi:hypothetical protein
LAEALRSVLVQSEPDWECLVVDDASGSSPDVPSDPRFRIIERTTNGGTAAARNSGLDNARGRYVTFLDDDDLFMPNRLRLATSALSRAPVVLCWCRYIEGTPTPGRALEGDVSNPIVEGLIPHVGMTVVPRELAPRFDESLRSAEDVDWWIRLAAVAQVTTVPQVGYLFRRRGHSEPGKTAALKMRGQEEVLRRHAAYFASRPRAAAFRWKRVGLLALAAGDRARARSAFRQAARIHPEPRTLWHLARAMLPRQAPHAEVSSHD